MADAPAPPPRIAIEDLTVTIDDREILRGVSVTVAPDEILCVMGLSGSGKSTLLRCVAGLAPATSGSIRIDGAEITGLTEAQLIPIRAKMGVVFQYAALFDSMTVFENIAFGITRGPRRHEYGRLSRMALARRVAERLRDVGLSGIERRMPGQLSGGMRRRVGLARALATEPEIVLYDEPTSGLDPVTAAAIDELIRTTRERQGVTSIIVSHDINSIFRVADRVLMLYEGRVQILGTPDEIRASDDPVVRQFIRGETNGPILAKKREPS
jgi:phospholipid/cholesterol/gamma-HCH transport system ATP-binding protein